jgi:hypothetical protein
MNLLKKIVSDNEICYQLGKYPIDNNDNKIHVLYMAFYLNGTGIYRALLPALELNKTTTHAAIVNHLEPFSHQTQEHGFPVNITDDLIKWADHIVFATAFHNLKETIDVIRSVNKKSNLKFYLDIDDNYHVDMPEQDPVHVKRQREKLINNMRTCGNVICENKNLHDAYNSLLNYGLSTPPPKGYTQHNLTNLHIMPNLLSDDCYTGIEITPRTSDNFRIGMIFNPTQWRDIYPIQKTLIEINKKYKDSVELIVFGWNGKIKGKGSVRDAFHKVNYQWVPPVDVTDYFEKLANLHFDIALMPLLDNEFNRCKSYHKLLQYSQAGVVAICSDVEPYLRAIHPLPLQYDSPDIGLRHFVVDKWSSDIDETINDRKKLKAFAEYNKEIINKNYTWHTNCKILTDLFHA